MYYCSYERNTIHIHVVLMAHHGAVDTLDSDGASNDESKSAVSVVIAMLQAEQDRLQDSHRRTADDGLTCKRKAHATVAAESRTGDAIRADLDLEVMTVKRRRLVELSKDVLEARCPGFCTRTSLTDDEYLREASCALGSISNDVQQAALASQALGLHAQHGSER